MSPANENAVQSLSGGGMQVVFRREGDRYRHTAAGVLDSLEGGPNEIWPASPPLQSLSIERRANDVQVALLVGMAGNSHWSLSVELDPQARSATFDVACRVKRGPALLLSSYVIDAKQFDRAVIAAEEKLLVAPGVALETLPVDDTPAAELRVDPHGKQLAIIQTIDNFALPQTFRWRYRFTLQDTR